jgi:hypothetical protein
LLGVIGIYLLFRGADHSSALAFFAGFALIVVGTVLVVNGLNVIADEVKRCKNGANVSVDFLGSFDEIGSNVAHMKQPEYREGPEAQENFERGMEALFKVPKAAVISRKKRTPQPKTASVCKTKRNDKD